MADSSEVLTRQSHSRRRGARRLQSDVQDRVMLASVVCRPAAPPIQSNIPRLMNSRTTPAFTAYRGFSARIAAHSGAWERRTRVTAANVQRSKTFNTDPQVRTRTRQMDGYPASRRESLVRATGAAPR